MEQITPSRLAIICNGTYYGDTEIKDREVSSITTDSREITDGGLFIKLMKVVYFAVFQKLRQKRHIVLVLVQKRAVYIIV